MLPPAAGRRRSLLTGRPTLSCATPSFNDDVNLEVVVSTSKTVAASRTVCAIGPAVSNEVQSGMTPFMLSSPALGRCPTMPHSALGQRMEPEVSVPMATTHIPEATAAPAPEEDPPLMRSVSHGFLVGPNALTTPLIPKANSCRLSLPMITAPASFSWRTTSASWVGMRSRY